MWHEQEGQLTFPSLGIGDLNFEVRDFPQLLLGCDSLFQVSKRNMDAIKCGGVVVDTTFELVVYTRHVPSPPPLLLQQVRCGFSLSLCAVICCVT